MGRGKSMSAAATKPVGRRMTEQETSSATSPGGLQRTQDAIDAKRQVFSAGEVKRTAPGLQRTQEALDDKRQIFSRNEVGTAVAGATSVVVSSPRGSRSVTDNRLKMAGLWGRRRGKAEGPPTSPTTRTTLQAAPRTLRGIRKNPRSSSETETQLALHSEPESVVPPNAAMRLFGSENAGLVEARPVNEESIRQLPQAESLHPRAERREAWASKHLLGCAALVVVGLTALVLGLVFGLDSSSSPKPTATSSRVTSSPTTTRIPPSVPLSSSAPTANPLPLDSMLEGLPASTLAAIKLHDSPQSRAYNWLLQHQNITFLPDWRKTQLFSMACIYFSYGGPFWPNGLDKDWIDDKKGECDWYSSGYGFLLDDAIYYGHSVCGSDGELLLLDLDIGIPDQSSSGVAINPKLPPEIGLLSSLIVIGLKGVGNSVCLSDLLPAEISLLDNLTTIDVDGTGTIPTYVGTFTQLESFRVFGNSLTGPLPTQLGLMTSLQRLLLDGQWGLSGTIPTQVGTMTSLQELFLHNNSFVGSIPSEIGQLQEELQVLALADNDLEGSIPTEFGILGENFYGLYLHSNALTGNIPSELGLLSGENGKQILLFRNQLTGRIPSTLANISSLSALALSENLLSGPIPLELLHQQYPPDQDFWSPAMNFSNNPNLVGTVPDYLCGATGPVGCFLGSPPCWVGARACFTEYKAFHDFYQRGYAGCNLEFGCNGGNLCGCHCNCSST